MLRPKNRIKSGALAYSKLWAQSSLGSHQVGPMMRHGIGLQRLLCFPSSLPRVHSNFHNSKSRIRPGYWRLDYPALSSRKESGHTVAGCPEPQLFPCQPNHQTFMPFFCAKMSQNRFRNQIKRIRNRTSSFLQTAAWQTCKCLFWTVCSPCVCCIILIVPSQTRQTLRGPIEAPKPILPYPRRRALSLESTGLQHFQRTFPQNQSAFMTKLPLEIRRMVYEKALGEVSIHVALVDGKLVTQRCLTEDCNCYLEPLTTKHKLHIALPLLRTCRRM
jgi:hypothetical protein